MRILISTRTPTSIRNFDSTLRALAERGHELHVTFERMKKNVDNQTVQIDALCEEWPSVSKGMSPLPAKSDPLYLEAAAVRAAIDYLRYLLPEFRDAPKLRERSAQRAPAWALKLGGRVAGRRPAIKALTAALRSVERAIPQATHFEAFLREQRPDVLLVSPLVHDGPQGQVELLRAARVLGIPTGLLVHSWDNLTTKGMIHEVPDMVAVWNHDQVTEAVQMHGVPRDRLVVTGAATYDQWFGWSPSSDRATFCQKVGLDPEEPYLLYLGSSYFIAPKEGEFVADWLSQMRASHGLGDVGVLIRRHPVAPLNWKKFDESAWANVTFFPPDSTDPISRSTKTDYFDSIYHAAAIVGINTSALIETAVIGRSAHTLLVPKYRHTQQGTLHFRYLSRENGGPLLVTSDVREHFAGLARAAAGDAEGDEITRSFVRRFVRPLGDEVSATDALADAIVGLGQRSRAPLQVSKPRALAGRCVGRVLARRQRTKRRR